ncbi:MAG: hypothetical protein M5U12_06825 [Verrucomicrobia bacterium]|nr:hypothetical protein [Verrucomicrobiota bacterium]
MKPTLLTLSVLAVAPSWLLLATESAPDAGSGAVEDPSHFRIAERGQDFAVYQRLTAMTNAEGLVCFRTNQFTLLENGLHWYDQAAGEWKESQDLIESFPEGAIARYGPVRAIFAHDLNAESVFDLETPEGVRLRGGVRALEWLNELTGERVLLATVNARAPLELVPPNRLVARDAFDGLRADVMLEWRRNRFSQSVVLLETPLLPEGWEADPVRLAVITEFIDAPEPEINRVQIVTDGALETEDHLSIGFGGSRS